MDFNQYKVNFEDKKRAKGKNHAVVDLMVQMTIEFRNLINLELADNTLSANNVNNILSQNANEINRKTNKICRGLGLTHNNKYVNRNSWKIYVKNEMPSIYARITWN